MIITTTENIPGKQIVQTLGIVQGNTVRTKHIGKDFMAGLKTIVGGEIKGYTDMLTQARTESYNRMVNEATKLGADAIICMRFTTSQVMQNAAEILAFGTAVKLQ
jgi:uncharacterized protein YbjQ (UPF0145 family)